MTTLAFLALLAPCGLSAELVSYRLPITPGALEEVQPVRRIEAPRVVEVWNQYGGGHYNANVTEFTQSSKDGPFRRGKTVSVDLLREQRPKTPQELCELLLTNSVMKRIDHGALNEMVSRNYISGEQYGFYLESSHELAPQQMIYFESSSWLSVAQAREAFGGPIPWSVVSEIKAPAGLDREAAKALAESGDPSVSLRVRRASLRLVAGQLLDEMTGRITYADLPWQGERELAAKYEVERGKTPLIFEMGRAAQLKGHEGEVMELARFAAVAALHHGWVVRVLGGGDFPIEEMPVYIHSLDRAHTALYKRKVGAKEAWPDQDPNNTLLAVPLGKLIEKLPPQEMLEPLAEIMAASGGRFTVAFASRLLQLYRQTFRTDLDLSNGSRSLTEGVQGGIVQRDYSPSFEFRMRARIWPERNGLSESQTQDVLAALARASKLEARDQSLLAYKADAGEQDWPALYGLHPHVFSNLKPGQAYHLLSAISKTWSQEQLPASIRQADLVIALPDSGPENEKVASELESLGLTPLEKRFKGRAYHVNVSELAGLLERYRKAIGAASSDARIIDDFWTRYRVMADLSGL